MLTYKLRESNNSQSTNLQIPNSPILIESIKVMVNISIL
ncbi:MAG: hypothetical protein ACI865_001588 [Flavobacteriaceae bacterium]|jgi:hypothetical protein